MAQATGARNGGDRYADYVPVAERVEHFYNRFPNGRIVTNIMEHDREAGFVLIRAEIYRESDDAQPAATGHAFEVRGDSYVNKTSYIENGESSAVGRALALLGFEVKRSAQQTAAPTARPANSAPRPAPTPARPAATPTPVAVAASAAPNVAPAAATPPATPPPTPAAKPAPQVAADDLDAEILDLADSLGFDAVRVRKWVNNRYGVADGLEELDEPTKREVWSIFYEKVNSGK